MVARGIAIGFKVVELLYARNKLQNHEIPLMTDLMVRKKGSRQS